MKSSKGAKLVEEMNRGIEESIPTEKRAAEAVAFIEMCNESEAPEMKYALTLYNRDVNFRSEYRLIKEEEREQFCIEKVREDGVWIADNKETEVESVSEPLTLEQLFDKIEDCLKQEFENTTAYNDAIYDEAAMRQARMHRANTNNRARVKMRSNSIYELLEQNASLSFVQLLSSKLNLEQARDNNTLLIVAHICCEYIYNYSGVSDSDMLGVVAGAENHKAIKRQIAHKVHEIFQTGIMEKRESINSRLFGSESYFISQELQREIAKEIEVKVRSAEGQKNSGDSIGKSHKEIAKKELFYNAEEQRQITIFTNLLQAEDFKRVQERLAESGMRKGFAALFYGAPGTGKTESVLQIARQTGRNIFEVDASQIKGMYVGETEKAIKKLFDDYRKLVIESEVCPILLFNEADAVLGVRKERADSAVDKMHNSMQNIILQEMESLEGIMIATTNLTSNLDKAFERRFLYKVEFQRPTAEVKAKIWQSMLPTLTPEKANALAEKFDFSGGQIENISRKMTVDKILSGSEPPFEQIDALCSEEQLEKHRPKHVVQRQPIGFRQ